MASPEVAAEPTEITPQEIANLSWTHGTPGTQGASTIEEAPMQALSAIADFHAQNTSNAAQALAKATVSNAVAIDLAATEPTARFRDYDSQGQVNRRWQSATLECLHVALLAVMLEAFLTTRNYNAMNPTNMAWLRAKPGHTKGSVVRAVVEV